MKMIVTLKNRVTSEINNEEIEVDGEMTSDEIGAEAASRYNAVSGNLDPDYADLFGGVLESNWAQIFWHEILSCRAA